MRLPGHTGLPHFRLVVYTAHMERIVVLDFGSQYAHLIAKRFRRLGYYADVVSPAGEVQSIAGARGIVLSGGPSSVYENPPPFNAAIFDLPVPILGLCYGHQLLAKHYGGTVERGAVGEFGIAELNGVKGESSPVFSDVTFPTQVWMSHQDAVTTLPPGFIVTTTTKDCFAAGIERPPAPGKTDWRLGLQFHVEVKDTLLGEKMLGNFARLCAMPRNWDEDAVFDRILAQIRREAGEGAAAKKVLLFLSGGVDSTVAFALLNRALGQDRILGLHIDNGFMRKNESAAIAARYRSFGFTNFIVEDASELFLAAVAGETDPQKKRSAVGETFITARNAVVARLRLNDDEWLLAQGTLYPDIIESGGTQNAHTIKTHHNRVAGIQALMEKGLIIEPLKDLYKDEVRVMGRRLNLSGDLVMRHPFPGPGLSINVLCSDGVVPADFAATENVVTKWAAAQTPAVHLSVLPVRSVGVQGDFRTYRFPAVLPSKSCTFDRDAIDWDLIEALSSRLTNGVPEVNRLVAELFRREGALRLQQGFCDKGRLDQTREADAIVIEELHRFGWYERIFQHLTINLPFAASPAHCSIVLRPVVSEDVMTARFARLPPDLLAVMVTRISGLPFVDAVFYDVTNKPPATFAWE